jgi:hypothetical protein
MRCSLLDLIFIPVLEKPVQRDKCEDLAMERPFASKDGSSA